MTAIPKSLGAITMFVEDVARAKAFYEKVFGVAAAYEDDNAVAFDFDNTIINLLREPAAHELIQPAEVGGRAAPTRFQLTIWVEDTDAICAELQRRGVELHNGPIDRPWGLRTATFADPDGHIWEVAAKIAD